MRVTTRKIYLRWTLVPNCGYKNKRKKKKEEEDAANLSRDSRWRRKRRKDDKFFLVDVRARETRWKRGVPGKFETNACSLLVDGNKRRVDSITLNQRAEARGVHKYF